MKKVNIIAVPRQEHASPKGAYGCSFQEISVALGANGESPDPENRHPFDLALVRIPAGKRLCPYHAHSEQWELYVIISGRGQMRHPGGVEELSPGDSIMLPPNEAHQIMNPGPQELVYYVIADNPTGEWCHYPDSGKFLVRGRSRHVLAGKSVDYLDGEE
jgi:uncharacterized cupin superfamily protein